MSSEEAKKVGGSVPPSSPADSLVPPVDSDMPERAQPERIGRYQLCFELASGGMATVYLARTEGTPGFEKLVALKRIHRHLAKERDYVEMFLDEARIASRITHSNVCSVFDFGESKGEYYIAMEYLVGEPLSRVYRRVAANAEQRGSRYLPLRMARVIADACEGLHAAHELRDANGDLLNVVHRDVSARNLFVTYDGVVQVVDFGIASARQRVHHTSTGQVKGTFPYMAPEQLTAGVMDRRVDIWALGVVLWELLTLKRLFRRDTDVNTMYAVLSDEIRPPSHFRPDVPAELDEIVLRALRRNPDERYQNSREMGQALTRFLANQRDIIGPAELSEWMRELFPQGEVRKRQLMEIARSASEEMPVLSGRPDETRFTATASADDLRRRVPGAHQPGVWALVLGALAMLGLVAFQSLRKEEPPPQPPQVEKPLTPVTPTAVTAEGTTSGQGKGELGEGSAGVGTTSPKETKVVKPPPPKKPKKRRGNPTTGPKGTINLVTIGGWAHVYSDGKKIGTTPTMLSLPQGTHRLVLKSSEESKPRKITVKVVAGKTKRYAIDLVRSRR